MKAGLEASNCCERRGFRRTQDKSADILAAHEVVDGNGEPDADGNRDVKALQETVEDGIQSHPDLIPNLGYLPR